MGKKSLDHDDVSIWKKVTETVTPILRQSFGVKASYHDEDLTEKSRGTSKKTASKPNEKHMAPTGQHTGRLSPAIKTDPEIASKVMRKAPSLTPADLDTTGYGGISRSRARSIKTGQSGYTSKIDLHGLSREKAHIKLRQFIQKSASNGHRHVLVITGKGAAGKGVIRSYFPVWLNEPPLSDLVIAYCQAQPKDGGGGAWYVNLRS